MDDGLQIYIRFLHQGGGECLRSLIFTTFRRFILALELCINRMIICILQLVNFPLTVSKHAITDQ